jgi:Rrf2 family protein
VHVTARADYALRAVLQLAVAPDWTGTRHQLSEAQAVPAKFLESILIDLRRAGLLEAQRGSRGGYRLSSPPERISLADVIRAVEGPLAAVRGAPPEDTRYAGPAAPLTDVWVALRASMRSVLEETSVADVVDGTLPHHVRSLLEEPHAWERR